MLATCLRLARHAVIVPWGSVYHGPHVGQDRWILRVMATPAVAARRYSQPPVSQGLAP